MIHFFLDTLPTFLFEAFKFFLVAVVFKIIVLHWFAERLVRWFTNKSARNMAIWQHFVKRSYGQGHASHYVLECYEGNCAKL